MHKWLVGDVPFYLKHWVKVKDRPKTGFTFSAENENGTENELSFSARNRNENESWLSFSAENENENENKYFK